MGGGEGRRGKKGWREGVSSGVPAQFTVHGRIVLGVIFNLVTEVLLLRSLSYISQPLLMLVDQASVTEVNEAVVLYYFKTHNDHCNRNDHNETLSLESQWVYLCKCSQA